MKKIILIALTGILFIASPLMAQNSQASSGGSSSIFASKEGKTIKKSSKKRNKKAYKNSSKRKGLFAKKKGSDCDCPGNPKAKRKRRK